MNNDFLDDFLNTTNNKNECLLKVNEIFSVLLDLTRTERAVFYNSIKSKFNLTSREIEDIKADLNKYESVEKTSEKEKIELSEEEKKEAITYLQHPDLMKKIIKDITVVGEIIGEEDNLILLYLVYTSRILDKPISCVTYAQSSSGKSFLNKQVLDFMPPEDSHVFSSMSEKSLEYLSEDKLNHTVIYIEEIEGAMSVLSTIRLVQSEGKLNRCVTVQNPKTNKFEAIHEVKKAPCVINYTTTRDSIHDENSTRIYEIYLDESVSQTARIVKRKLQGFKPDSILNNIEKQRLLQLHRNAQRLLVPYKVYIPFSDYLIFPSKITRHRRDSERFRILIELIALLRQFQKEIKENNGVKYIEADIRDYETAFNLSKSVFSNVIHNLSDRARSLLRVIDDLENNLDFTIKDVREKAVCLGVDASNYNDVVKIINSLVKYEYVNQIEGGQGKTGRYKRESSSVNKDDICSYLISPEELKLKTETYTFAVQDTPSHTHNNFPKQHQEHEAILKTAPEETKETIQTILDLFPGATLEKKEE